MANAATITVGITATPDPGNNISLSNTVTYAPAGNDTVAINQATSTSDAALSLGSLTTTTAKLARIRASSDNGAATIDVGVKSGGTTYYFATLAAGDILLLPFKSAADIQVKASAGTPELFISAFQV